MKNWYRGGGEGGDCLKTRGLDSLQIEVGAWQERGGGVFKGGLIPWFTLCKLELRFCAGSNPARGLPDICIGEDLSQ